MNIRYWICISQYNKTKWRRSDVEGLNSELKFAFELRLKMIWFMMLKVWDAVQKNNLQHLNAIIYAIPYALYHFNIWYLVPLMKLKYCKFLLLFKFNFWMIIINRNFIFILSRYLQFVKSPKLLKRSIYRYSAL